MKLKSIFKKTPVTKPEVKEAASQVKPEVPEGLLKRCNKCGKGIFTEDYKKNLYICILWHGAYNLIFSFVFGKIQSICYMIFIIISIIYLMKTIEQSTVKKDEI